MRIRLDGLTRHHRPGAGLDDVTLSIEDGETLSVVGPSGCGKSTLLRLVAGLDEPDAGTVHYDDHDMAGVPARDRGIGMVFQDYALYPTKKGRGNLSYFFEVHKRTEAETEERAREIASVMGVGFDLLLGQLPTTLSGGEQQRLAIARCIVRDPTLFLMDEPICNLDAKLRESTRMEIAKLLRRFGITTLYVTHDQQEAVFMGDRIAVLRAGRLAQAGTFDELYGSPANLFVATFFGARPTAVLPVTVADRHVHADGARWPLPDELADRLPPGPLRLGVRPEGWLIDSADGVPMRLNRLEPVPAERLVLAHGTVAGEAVVAVVPDGVAPQLIPDWERALFFAADAEDAVHTPGVPDFF
jgi:ABC-type sugar transport system ATPase subunit